MVLENQRGWRDGRVCGSTGPEIPVCVCVCVCVIILHSGLPATEQKMMLNRTQQVNAAQVI